MARKQITVTIDTQGRDFGKTFRLTEMPASQAEKWAMRAFLALAKSGVQIPNNIATSGLAGIAALGLEALGGVDFADAESLMDEMFQCIACIPDLSRPTVVRALIEDDIEEISTRVKLRKEVFGLHVNFSMPAAGLTSSSTATGANTPTT
jgi:hypothetical protein